MPFEFKSVTTNTNKSVLLEFTQPIVSYVAGYAYSTFSISGADHHVREYSLRLSSNQPQPKQLNITVTGILEDGNGNKIDNSISKVTVCVLAWVGTNPGTLALASATGINNGASSAGFALPSPTLGTLQSVLNGFDLAYSGSDHHVLYETSGVGVQQNGTSASIVGKAAMGDASGNTASTAYVNGGLIAISAGSDLGAEFKGLSSTQTSDSFQVNFSRDLSSALVMVIDSYASFSADHHIKTVGSGCSGWRVDGNTVTLDNARSFLSDGSGNRQDDAESSVTLLVIGLYA